MIQAIALGALAMLAIIQPASAGILLDQPGIVDGSGAPSGGGSVAFEDFNLPQADTVTSLSWFGVPVPSGTIFVINLSTDSSPGSGLPNLTPFATETVTPTFTSTGYDTSIFTVTLPTPVALPASTDLWISIVGPSDDTDNGDSFWQWNSASAAPDPGALPDGDSILDENGTLHYLGTALSFELMGAPTVATPAPEPASLALLGTGLFGLVLKRRAKPRI